MPTENLIKNTKDCNYEKNFEQNTESEDVAQAIIKSTNKQTKVEDNDLLALTQFQRNLEDYFSGFEGDLELYYERRAKQFANVTGLEKGRITNIGSQLKSFASMFLVSAHQAGRYQGTLLKVVKDKVFNDNVGAECLGFDQTVNAISSGSLCS